MPHLQEFSIELEGKTVFSKIDLVRAYNQVPMRAADVAKTAIVTPFGLFEYTRMPFGLKNAAQTFQRCMDNVFEIYPLRMFAYVYLDDILVASTSSDEHDKHLRQLFCRLADYVLVLNPHKCVLASRVWSLSDDVPRLLGYSHCLTEYSTSQTSRDRIPLSH